MPKQTPKIPDREDFDANEWGNIKHPTLSEAEVLTKEWYRTQKRSDQAKQNLRQGVKKREKNGWYKKTINARVDQSNPDYIKKHKQGLEKRSQNKSWLKNVSKAAKQNGKKSSAKIKETMALKKAQDPQGYEKWVKERAKKKQKRIQTPDGIFESRLKCAEYYNHGPSWVLSQIKSRKDWFYIND